MTQNQIEQLKVAYDKSPEVLQLIAEREALLRASLDYINRIPTDLFGLLRSVMAECHFPTPQEKGNLLRTIRALDLHKRVLKHRLNGTLIFRNELGLRTVTAKCECGLEVTVTEPPYDRDVLCRKVTKLLTDHVESEIRREVYGV